MRVGPHLQCAHNGFAEWPSSSSNSLSLPERDECPVGMARSIPKPGRNTHSVAAPNARSYASEDKDLSVRKISNNGGIAMFKRILFFAYGSLSYLIFLGT